jgi:hypothetical protein
VVHIRFLVACSKAPLQTGSVVNSGSDPSSFGSRCAGPGSRERTVLLGTGQWEARQDVLGTELWFAAFQKLCILDGMICCIAKLLMCCVAEAEHLDLPQA